MIRVDEIEFPLYMLEPLFVDHALLVILQFGPEEAALLFRFQESPTPGKVLLVPDPGFSI